MKSTSISSLLPYPKILFSRRAFPPINFSSTAPFSGQAKFLSINCSNSSENGEMGNLKDALTGIVDERVEELLKREENRVLLDGLEKATLRVEMAKKELAEIERQELEAKLLKDYITQLETRTSEIAECQKDILEARAMIEEAERSLNVSGDARKRDPTDGDVVNRDEERVESVKAASLSAIVGTLAGLPIFLSRISSSSELILPLSITFISCALFGVTFRYAVRRDFDNFQLKSGTSAAFGVVKGLATLGGGPPLELDAASFWSHALDGAVYVSENLLIFLFAGVGLDLCFKQKKYLTIFFFSNMVSRVEATMKIRQQTEVKNSNYQIVQCKKGKTNKFKRSSSNVEEDGASAAILLLACIACTTTSHL